MHSNNNYNKTLRPYANSLRKKMTKAEACLWKYVLRARMLSGHQFRRQRPVDKYIVDFVCLKLKLVIEVDGITHEHGEVANRDQVRQDRLEELGFTVIRFTDDEVLSQINRVRESILGTIEGLEMRST